jgi:hypothetical protein
MGGARLGPPCSVAIRLEMDLIMESGLYFDVGLPIFVANARACWDVGNCGV